MDVLVLTIFVSLCLVACGLLLLGAGLRARTQDHTERLALLPLETEATRPVHSDDVGPATRKANQR